MLKLPVLLALVTALSAGVTLAGCSPKFNWRDYHGADAPYTAMFPGKPSTYTRPVNLGQATVDMTMTAAEVDGVTFAIGNAEMRDPAQAKAAVTAMKTALINNINGTVKHEKAAEASSSSGGTATKQSSVEIEASGVQNGMPLLLHGRFIAKDARIYQVIVVGKERDISGESVKTFMDAFKPN
jgi:hypothetical protein